AFPIFDKGGAVTAIAGIMRDITDQRAQDDIDRERQEVLALAYRSLNIGIFISSEDGVIQSANDEGCAQFQRSREELVGLPYWEVLPKDLREHAQTLHRVRMTTEPGSLGQMREWPITLPGGEDRI